MQPLSSVLDASALTLPSAAAASESERSTGTGAAVEAEAKKNAAKAAADQAAIKTKYAKIAAVHAKAEKMYHQAEALKAKALATKRAAKAKATADKAAKIEKAYQKLKNGKLKKMQDAADAAKKKASDAVAKAKADAAKAKKAMDEEDDADAEAKSCAMDGSECMTPDEKCHKVTPKGPYLAKDLVHCTDKKPKCAVGEDCEGQEGLKWANIGTTSTPTPAPATPACKKALAAFKKTPIFGSMTTPSAIACASGKGVTEAKVKAAIEAFWGAGALCPPMCNKAAAKVVKEADGQTTTIEMCITADDIAGLVFLEMATLLINHRDVIAATA